MSKNTKTDRRVRRTITNLQKALKQLMAQKPYAKIKVSEIVVLADVARPTFYMHFETKDALLYSLFDDVFDTFKLKLAEDIDVENFNLKNIAVNTFKYWELNAETLEILLDAQIDLIVLEQFRQCIADTSHKIRTAKQIESTPAADYIDDYLAGGLYMLLKRWVQSGRKMSPEEMSLVFDEVVGLSL